MKKLAALSVVFIMVLFVVTGCAKNQQSVQQNSDTYEVNAKDISVTSTRNSSIPAVFTYPKDVNNCPFVIIAHGHGGDKTDWGGLTALAEKLAAKGIASIRMDFPGCGQSMESFDLNTIQNMKDDMESCLEYAIDSGKIDSTKVGLLGYSMGGRAVTIMAGEDADNKYKSIALWAPYIIEGEEALSYFFSVMGTGPDQYSELYNIAKTNGYADFTTIYMQEQKLSKEWFDQIRDINPLEKLANYKGEIFVARCSGDTTISEDVFLQIENAATLSKKVTTLLLEGSDHGFGFYGTYDDKKIADQTLDATVDYFKSTLN